MAKAYVLFNVVEGFAEAVRDRIIDQVEEVKQVELLSNSRYDAIATVVCDDGLALATVIHEKILAVPGINKPIILPVNESVKQPAKATEE